MTATVAALYVDPTGPYANRDDVDAWTEDRDARLYAGPLPVVAHPPCSRWGRFWWRGELGADGGCFEAALHAIEKWGGVLEHPEGSLAWAAFNLPVPKRDCSWTSSLFLRGFSCSVDQAVYGHRARKRTWLYYQGKNPPAALDWRRGENVAVAVAANARTRRLGIEIMGKRESALTPPAFAEALLSLARGAR